MKLFKKAVAELIGTFVLVAFACGTACAVTAWGETMGSAAKDVAIALSFGLVICAMAYSIGNVSGCHINPAVSFGVLISNYLKPKKERTFGFVDFIVYLVAQFAGAFLGCVFLYLVFGPNCGFGANQASDVLKSLSADNYQTNAFGVETVLTFVFVLAVLGVTSKEKYSNVAGIVIGLSLTLVHLIGIPLTGTSVNPARSLAPAVFAAIYGGNSVPLNEIWIYICGPLLGGLIAALVYWFITYEAKKAEPVKAVAAPVEEKKPAEEKKPVAEKKAEPKPVEKKAAPVKVAPAPKADEVVKQKEVGERVKFVDKLKTLDKPTRDKYYELQKELLAYGIKSRVSAEGDTYRLHKEKYAFITVRGKSIKLYLALKPKDYKDSPIPVKDEGGKKKYEEVPAVLKVKSDLSLKRGVQLIDDCMAKNKIEKLPEEKK